MGKTTRDSTKLLQGKNPIVIVIGNVEGNLHLKLFELKRKKFRISPLPQVLIALVVHRHHLAQIRPRVHQVRTRHLIRIAPAVMKEIIAITSPRKITAKNLRLKNLLLTKTEKEKKALKISYKNIWPKPKNEKSQKVENDKNNKCLFKNTQCFFYAK